MKLLPYFIALLTSSLISAIAIGPLTFIYGYMRAYLYKEPLSFWSGLWLAGINSFILVNIASWIFSWFGYTIPILFIIIITVLVFTNNLNRYNTRNNHDLELGYLVGELLAIPAIYYTYYSSHNEGFVFL